MEDATSLVLRAKDGDVHAFAGLYAQIIKICIGLRCVPYRICMMQRMQ